MNFWDFIQANSMVIDNTQRFIFCCGSVGRRWVLVILKRLQKLKMEIKDAALEFIGFENGDHLSTVRQKQSASETPQLATLEIQPHQSRKLRLEYEELMRKKTLQKRIEEREKAVEQRLQAMKSKQRLNSTHNQKMWVPDSQEKVYKSPKKGHNSLEKKAFETQIGFKKKGEMQKENAFRVYHKSGKLSELPKIRKERVGAKDESLRTQGEEFSLVDFGIFSEKRKANGFLKKLKATLEREFVGGVDFEREEQLRKLQTLVLSEVGNERRLATE